MTSPMIRTKTIRFYFQGSYARFWHMWVGLETNSQTGCVASNAEKIMTFSISPTKNSKWSVFTPHHADPRRRAGTRGNSQSHFWRASGVMQSRCLLKRREKIEYPIPMFSFWSAEYRARFRVVGPLISCGVVGLQENIR